MEMLTSVYNGTKVITVGENRIDAAIAVRFLLPGVCYCGTMVPINIHAVKIA